MPALPRHTQKVFGGSLTPTGNVALYGSLAAGSPAYPASTDDLGAIQTAEWLLGLNGALIGNRSPAVEDLNAVFVVLSQQIAYLLQNGIPEWDSGTTYYLGQVVRFAGTALTFTSLSNSNTGNDPSTDTNNWSSSGTSNPTAASMSVSQTVDVDGDGHKIQFNATDYDPFGRYNSGTYLYTAPVAGAYLVTGNIQVDNVSGAAATMELALRVVKNGSVVLRAAGASVANPPGSRWYPKIATTVVLALGDTVELQLEANDTVNSGTVTVSNSDWSIHKLP
jgi:hypothetical protein